MPSCSIRLIKSQFLLKALMIFEIFYHFSFKFPSDFTLQFYSTRINIKLSKFQVLSRKDAPYHIQAKCLKLSLTSIKNFKPPGRNLVKKYQFSYLSMAVRNNKNRMVKIHYFIDYLHVRIESLIRSYLCFLVICIDPRAHFKLRINSIWVWRNMLANDRPLEKLRV